MDVISEFCINGLGSEKKPECIPIEICWWVEVFCPKKKISGTVILFYEHLVERHKQSVLKAVQSFYKK